MRPRFYYLKSFIRFALSRTPLKLFSKSEIYKHTLERVARLHYDQVAGYYSQSGQDHFIDTFVLNRKTNGVFVDVGANDGVNLSNSYYFEEKRGWTGLCVEPNPLLFNLLVKARRCHLEECCAGKQDGQVSFKFFDSDNHIYGRELSFDEAQSESKSQVDWRPILVSKRDINYLLEKHALFKIDYLSIDIEGGELDLFQAIDLVKFSVDVVSLEQNDDAANMDEAMFDLSYLFLAKIGCDRIYRKKPNTSVG